MTTPPTVLSAIRWSELFPWLLLVRAARVALMARVIVLALAGVVLTQLGWSTIDATLLDDDAPHLVALTDRAPPRLWRTPEELQLPAPQTAVDLDAIAPTDGALSTTIARRLRPGRLFDEVETYRYAGPLVRGWAWPMQPFTRLVDAPTWRVWFASLAASAWTLAVWSPLGGAIARIAGLYLTRGETLGPIEALRSMALKSLSIAGAPAFCLAVIALAATLLALAGLLIRVNVFALLAGLGWAAILVGGLVIALLAIGLFIGWPLIWAAGGVDRADSFDAINRSFTYAYLRPLHLAFYLAVATLLGLASHAGVSVVADATLKCAHWAVAGGSGEARLATLLDPPVAPAAERLDAAIDADAAPARLGLIDRGASRLIRFWTMSVLWIVAAFPMAYLFPAATGLYLLLRRLVDSTEMTEASLDDNPPRRGLPSLAPDADTGVPQVVSAKSPA